MNRDPMTVAELVCGLLYLASLIVVPAAILYALGVYG